MREATARQSFVQLDLFHLKILMMFSVVPVLSATHLQFDRSIDRGSKPGFCVRLSPPERRYADVLGLSDWPRYPDSGLAEPKGNKLHDLR